MSALYCIRPRNRQKGTPLVNTKQCIECSYSSQAPAWVHTESIEGESRINYCDRLVVISASYFAAKWVKRGIKKPYFFITGITHHGKISLPTAQPLAGRQSINEISRYLVSQRDQ